MKRIVVLSGIAMILLAPVPPSVSRPVGIYGDVVQGRLKICGADVPLNAHNAAAVIRSACSNGNWARPLPRQQADVTIVKLDDSLINGQPTSDAQHPAILAVNGVGGVRPPPRPNLSGLNQGLRQIRAEMGAIRN